MTMLGSCKSCHGIQGETGLNTKAKLIMSKGNSLSHMFTNNGTTGSSSQAVATATLEHVCDAHEIVDIDEGTDAVAGTQEGNEPLVVSMVSPEQYKKKIIVEEELGKESDSKDKDGLSPETMQATLAYEALTAPFCIEDYCIEYVYDDQPPKRPLSAYNLFFRLKRQRILETDNTATEIGSKNSDYRPFTIEEVAQFAIKENIIIASKNSHLQEMKPKRKHRKSHGKITFTDLARTIANAWKQMLDSERCIFHGYFYVEMKRYKKLLDTWTKIKEGKTVAFMPNPVHEYQHPEATMIRSIQQGQPQQQTVLHETPPQGRPPVSPKEKKASPSSSKGKNMFAYPPNTVADGMLFDDDNNAATLCSASEHTFFNKKKRYNDRNGNDDPLTSMMMTPMTTAPFVVPFDTTKKKGEPFPNHPTMPTSYYANNNIFAQQMQQMLMHEQMMQNEAFASPSSMTMQQQRATHAATMMRQQQRYNNIQQDIYVAPRKMKTEANQHDDGGPLMTSTRAFSEPNMGRSSTIPCGKKNKGNQFSPVQHQQLRFFQRQMSDPTAGMEYYGLMMNQYYENSNNMNERDWSNHDDLDHNDDSKMLTTPDMTDYALNIADQTFDYARSSLMSAHEIDKNYNHDDYHDHDIQPLNHYDTEISRVSSFGSIDFSDFPEFVEAENNEEEQNASSSCSEGLRLSSSNRPSQNITSKVSTNKCPKTPSQQQKKQKSDINRALTSVHNKDVVSHIRSVVVQQNSLLLRQLAGPGKSTTSQKLKHESFLKQTKPLANHQLHRHFKQHHGLDITTHSPYNNNIFSGATKANSKPLAIASIDYDHSLGIDSTLLNIDDDDSIFHMEDNLYQEV